MDKLLQIAMLTVIKNIVKSIEVNDYFHLFMNNKLRYITLLSSSKLVILLYLTLILTHQENFIYSFYLLFLLKKKIINEFYYKVG